MNDDINSILTSVKKAIGGLYENDETFDLDILMFINSEFATLNQLGVGPEEGFKIEDKSATWSDFITDPRLNFVKEYVIIKVRLSFDTSISGGYKEVLQSKAKELEWRINVAAEQIKD